METATLTFTTHEFSSRSRKTSCAGIGRRRKRALTADKRHAHRQIGLGSFCIQSRIRGSPAQCASLLPLGSAGTANIWVNPLLPLETGRRSTPSFSAEGGGDFSASNRLFCSRSTVPYKWHRWLQSPSRSTSVACRGRSSDLNSDEFGPYPWDPLWNASDNEAIEWIQEDIVTLFTTDGLIQIGGSLIPHHSSPTERKQSRGKAPVRYRRFREEDYMDPKQGLCLGAIFDIVATNGLDMGRRLCVFGFCRSVEMLSDVVEDTVLEHGGEVVVAAKGNWGGLNEKLSMRVAVPLLWGVPPAVDTLNYAIRCGGGIVEKVSCQWEFL